MLVEYAADAPAAHGVALSLHLGAPPAGAIALAARRKGLTYGYLPGRFSYRYLLAALLGVVRGRGHPQHLAELAHWHVVGPLGDMLIHAHGVGWLSLRL